jgi:hypothetical protein
MNPLINYKEFLAKRFDLVVRYHILREVDFDFDKARYTIVNSEKYKELRVAYRILGLPITPKMKRNRLWKICNGDLSLFMAHNQFFVKNYHWIEEAMHTDYWMYAEPYGVNSKNSGIPTKRFLVALKLNKPLLWQQGRWLDSYKMVPRLTRNKIEYKKLLSKKTFDMFERTQRVMMKHMFDLEFFTEKFKIEMPTIEYKKFLHNRFDFVVRYFLLEQSDFDVRKAQQLWEVKVEKGEPVVIENASSDYNYLDKMLKGKLFFDQLQNWDHIDRKLKKSNDWLMYNPYIITTHGIGISLKRFLIAIKYKRLLYWIATDAYNDKYNSRVTYAPWHEDLYDDHLTKKEIAPFKEAKFRLMARMTKLNFFCEDTKIGGLANEHFRFRDLPNR